MLPVARRPGRPATVLNLFAYTGLATLALARRRRGRSRTSTPSRPAVPWARRNAELSGLADRRPLDRRRRPGLRGARSPARPPLRRPRPRPAVVRARARRPAVVDGRPAGRCSPPAAASSTPGAFVLLTAHTPGLRRRAARPACSATASAGRAAADRGRRAGPARPPTAGAWRSGPFARHRPRAA